MIRLASPKRLRAQGIMGMNRRNNQYIAGFNPRALFPLVDNKLKTKLLAQQHGIAVPKLLGVIKYQHQIKGLLNVLEGYDQFVIKPAKGSGGKGILVISSREHEVFFKPSEQALNLANLKRHTSNILSGLYSLGGSPDVAMIEEMIQFDPVFEPYCFEGVPDIRVIVFKGYPVMAMLRLSTHASDGKANLHQGAVGVGLNLADGSTSFAVQNDRPVTTHPDTGTAFSELVVPHWERIMKLAASCFDITGLGYLGVDVVLDAHQGPLIIELNARPGLAIQVANGTGIRPRLERIAEIAEEEKSHEARAEFSRRAFAI